MIESRWWLPKGATYGDGDGDKVKRLRAVDLGVWKQECEAETVDEWIREKYRALREDGFMFCAKDDICDLVR